MLHDCVYLLDARTLNSKLLNDCIGLYSPPDTISTAVHVDSPRSPTTDASNPQAYSFTAQSDSMQRYPHRPPTSKVPLPRHSSLPNQGWLVRNQASKSGTNRQRFYRRRPLTTSFFPSRIKHKARL